VDTASKDSEGSKAQARGVGALLAHEERWDTEMGKWFPGERVVFRGQDLHHDLRDMGWIEMLVFAITGRRFEAKPLRLLEACCTLVVSYPDPSIWPNHVAALAGTARSTGALGIAAAYATEEAEIFGLQPFLEIAAFAIRARERLAEGADLQKIVFDTLKVHRKLPGFGRPIVPADERVGAVLGLARELGLASGPNMQLFFELQRVLADTFGAFAMKPTIAALLAPLMADLGLSPRETYRFFILAFGIGYVACFTDAETKPEGTFFPLRCSRVRYEGAPRRAWGCGAPQGRP